MSWQNFSGVVEKCTEEGSWFIVMVPPSCVPPKELRTGNFGFIPIIARVSTSEWETSLLPAGDGAYFVALPKKVRVKQGIDMGSKVSIEFCLRERNK